MVALLRGPVTYSFDGNSIDLTAAQINVGPTTGALRLRFALGVAPVSTTAFPGEIGGVNGPSISVPAAGTILTAQDTGPLTLDLSNVPVGTYYPILELEEYLGAATANPDGFAIRDYAVFSMPFIVSGAVGGHAQFVGSIGYTASTTSAELKIAKIGGSYLNASGPLVVQLVLTAAPFSPASGYTGAAQLTLPAVPANGAYPPIDQVVSLSGFSAGTYYATMVLQENTGNSLRIDDYVPLSGVFTAGASNQGSGTASERPQSGTSSTLQSGPLSPGAASTGTGGGSASDYNVISTTTIGIDRFFDTVHGTHFYTASASEANGLSLTRTNLTPEGIGLDAVNPANLANDSAAVPVYRFFDKVYGTHFFTASAAERSTLDASRSDLADEGIGFYEHAAQQTGDTAVHRFFDAVFGTHFYTSGSTEYNNILNTRNDLKDEGIGFYAPS